MTLAVAAVIGAVTYPPVAFGRVLTVLLAIAPVVVAILYLMDGTSGWLNICATAALVIYLLAYVLRALRTLTGVLQLRAVAIAAFLALAFSWATDALYVDPSVWYVPEDEDPNAYFSPTSEPLLFYQAKRIDEAVARMSPSDAVSPSAFFLGFAGYADQRVFAEEIKLAARNVGAKYGSTGRSLLLVNDRRSLEAAPLATPTSMRYALQAIAKKMDVSKDVLFLSVSSHGSSDGTISVANGTLAMNDLSASDLADALKQSGIRWRVVVVSACYSGTFIEPLRASGTAVITAAAADRTSFGCSDDRDLTYFGEAFYRDALPRAGSLREAFERTRKAIEDREKVEGVEPSHPQAEFGAGIIERVDGLSQLTTADKPLPPAPTRASTPQTESACLAPECGPLLAPSPIRRDRPPPCDGEWLPYPCRHCAPDL